MPRQQLRKSLYIYIYMPLMVELNLLVYLVDFLINQEQDPKGRKCKFAKV